MKLGYRFTSFDTNYGHHNILGSAEIAITFA